MKRLILACMVLFMSVSAVFAQSDLQVLAVIKMNKNESITVKQLKARVNTYQKQIGKALTVDEKKMVLDALIEERLSRSILFLLHLHRLVGSCFE